MIAPAGAWVMQLSTAVRRLQHGRLQAYIAYVLLGVAALAVATFAGGTP